MWPGGPEDHPFAKNSKSNAIRLYWFEKDNKVIYSAVNVSIWIDVPKGPSTSVMASETQTLLKCGRSLGSKDKYPRKRSMKNDAAKESH